MGRLHRPHCSRTWAHWFSAKNRIQIYFYTIFHIDLLYHILCIFYLLVILLFYPIKKYHLYFIFRFISIYIFPHHLLSHAMLWSRVRHKIVIFYLTHSLISIVIFILPFVYYYRLRCDVTIYKVEIIWRTSYDSANFIIIYCDLELLVMNNLQHQLSFSCSVDSIHNFEIKLEEIRTYSSMVIYHTFNESKLAHTHNPPTRNQASTYTYLRMCL